MNLSTKRAIGSLWHNRRRAQTAKSQGMLAEPKAMTDGNQVKELHDQDPEPARFQESAIDTIPQAIPSPDPESPLEITVEMNPFRYYYGSAEQPSEFTLPIAKRATKRLRLPRYLAGSGVIGATLISGVVIADLASHSKPQSLQSSPQSDVKQTPKSNLTQSQIAPPEVMSPQSTLAQSPNSSKKAFPLKLPVIALEQSSAKRLSQQAMVQPTIAVPEPPPAIDLPRVAVTVEQPRPKPLVSLAVRPPASITPLQKSPTNLSSQSSPLPSTYAVEPLPPTQPQTTPMPPTYAVEPLASNSTIVPSSKPTTLQSPSVDRCSSPIADAGKSSALDPRLIPVQASTSVSAPETVVAAVGSKAQLQKSALVKVAQAIVTQSPSLSHAEEDLQALLERPQNPTSAGVTILPLPCQAAQAAITQQEIGEFTVLRLSPQDYQKRWKTSSKNSQVLIPIYGFIDYKQQAIVLMQESSG